MPESHIALPSAPRHACTHIGIGQSALTQPRSLGQAVLLHKRCALLSDPLFFFCLLLHRYLLSLGADVNAENEDGDKPADLIDPDCKELLELFGVGSGD